MEIKTQRFSMLRGILAKSQCSAAGSDGFLGPPANPWIPGIIVQWGKKFSFSFVARREIKVQKRLD